MLRQVVDSDVKVLRSPTAAQTRPSTYLTLGHSSSAAAMSCTRVRASMVSPYCLMTLDHAGSSIHRLREPVVATAHITHASSGGRARLLVWCLSASISACRARVSVCGTEAAARKPKELSTYIEQRPAFCGDAPSTTLANRRYGGCVGGRRPKNRPSGGEWGLRVGQPATS